MVNQSASLARHHTSLHKNRLPTIVLVGFMGAGKTSVGKELARMLGWTFEDLDDRIQVSEGRTIEEIFRDSGEDGFRSCEHKALRAVLSEEENSARVIALGGGAFVQRENASLVQERNIPTVFLDAPVDELFRRCRQQDLPRPLHRNEIQFRELYEIRRPLYMAASHHIETHGKPVSQIARDVAEALGINPSK